ncbi:MAG: type I secretion system permease/ATPase [Burkholderiales bacterium]
MTQDRTELASAVRSLAPVVRRVGFYSALLGLLVFVPTIYMLEVYDRVVSSRSLTTLVVLTLMVTLAYAVMEWLQWVRSELLRGAALQFDEALMPRVLQAVHESNLRGPGGTQPLNDLRALREFIASQTVISAFDVPVASMFLIAIFFISPWLGLVALICAVVLVAVGGLADRRAREPSQKAGRAAIAAQQALDGAVRNAVVVRSMGMLGALSDRWLRAQAQAQALQQRVLEQSAISQAMARFIQTTLSSAMLGLGAWLLLSNTLQGGDVMLIIASVLAGRMIAPLVQSISQWRSVLGAREAWARLDEMLSRVPPAQPAMPLPVPRARLSVEQAAVTLPGVSAPVLRGVNFSLQAGEVLGVIGPSASGKTTLARLLTGILPSAGGKVRLDAMDVYLWDKAQLGPHVGYVPQSVDVLDGTVAENIARFGSTETAEAQGLIRSVIEAVGLTDLIASLPEGLQTRVGRDGERLSAGQRQRLALARALFGEPVFLVLDEPNSNLDEAGDQALAQAIEQRKQAGTITVVMTHRTRVLAQVDRLLVLREGAQLAFGPRDEILAQLHKAAQQARAAGASA